tara:strand:+ start:10979 stop:11626 length:648 start_codon:yes stop_codon:yes gene_type:complete
MKTFVFALLFTFPSVSTGLAQNSQIRFSISPSYALNFSELGYRSSNGLDGKEYFKPFNNPSLSFGVEYLINNKQALRLTIGGTYFGYDNSLGAYTDPYSGLLSVEEYQVTVASLISELSYKYFMKRRSEFNPYINLGISCETPLWTYSYTDDVRNDYQNSLSLLAGFGFEIWKRANLSIEGNPYIEYQVIDPYRLLDSSRNFRVGARLFFSFKRF